jgi:hypothetical protein
MIKVVVIFLFFILLGSLTYILKNEEYQTQKTTQGETRWICINNSCVQQQNVSPSIGYKTKTDCQNNCKELYYKCDTSKKQCTLQTQKTQYPQSDPNSLKNCVNVCSQKKFYACDTYPKTPIRNGKCIHVDPTTPGAFQCDNKDCQECKQCSQPQCWNCTCGPPSKCTLVSCNDHYNIKTDPTKKDSYKKVKDFACKSYMKCDKSQESHDFFQYFVSNTNSSFDGYKCLGPTLSSTKLNEYTELPKNTTPSEWCKKNCVQNDKTVYYWDQSTELCKAIQSNKIPKGHKSYSTMDKCYSANCSNNGLLYCKGASKCCNPGKCESCKNGTCIPKCANNECLSCVEGAGVCTDVGCSLYNGNECVPKGCKGSQCQCKTLKNSCPTINNMQVFDWNDGSHQKYLCPSKINPGWCINPDNHKYTLTFADGIPKNPPNPALCPDLKTKCVVVQGEFERPHYNKKTKQWEGSMGCWPLADNLPSKLPYN